MILLDEYNLIHKNDYIVVNPTHEIKCHCGGTTIKRGSKSRFIIDNEGNKQKYILKRVYCTACKKLHLLIPNFIYPYKHYDKQVIQSVLDDANDSCCADDSTIYRWKRNL